MASHSAATFADEAKPPGRCAAPGHKKALRQQQAKELGAGAGAATASAPAAASRPTAFSALADLPELADMFREVDPDQEARVLQKWAEHNRELKRQRRAHG